MEENERMSIEEAGDALRDLADELETTHSPPFTACVLDEHWEAIERALGRMVNGSRDEA
ncbi:hypothetical protein GJV26_29445 [Massilia dura]|uniref:Uncharacterized protein n=1 Tax=Pseudoduganella dura TaxID=321982 RepID=A0A6I3XPX7_9BURK|nr:hypothetical protein [Pseudoduganella dura]MUI16553.1 hypothetical protein [Pseudoduganella dura]GGY11618.1 hypothetical protein GCM10007386_47380 [Pseudoduganella dura]